MWEDGPGAAAPHLPSIDALREPFAAISDDGAIVYANHALSLWFPDCAHPNTLQALVPGVRWKRVGRSIGRYGRYRADVEAFPPPERAGGARKPTPCELRITPMGDGSGLWRVRVSDASRVREKEVLLEQYTKIIEGHTTKLKRQKKRIRELLDHMRQAVFCVDKRLKITGPVSRHTHALFGPDVEGKPLADVVFRDLAPTSEAYSHLLTALTTTMGEDDLQWELQEDLLPRRIAYTVPETDDVRTLQITWSPIWDADELVDRIMLVVEDRTETERLQREVALERQQGVRNIQMIQELAELDRDDLVRFLDRTAAALSDVAARVRAPALDHDDLFRTLHTLKGNARAFGFTLLATGLHVAESGVKRVQEGLVTAGEVAASIAEARGCLSAYSQLARRVFRVEDAFARHALHEVRRHLFRLDAALSSTPLHPAACGRASEPTDPAQLYAAHAAAEALGDAAQWANLEDLERQATSLARVLNRRVVGPAEHDEATALVSQVLAAAREHLLESDTLSQARWDAPSVMALVQLVERLHQQPLTARAMHHGGATCQSNGWWFLAQICERLEARLTALPSTDSVREDDVVVGLLNQAQWFADFCGATRSGSPGPVRHVLCRPHEGAYPKDALEALCRTENAAAVGTLMYLEACGGLDGGCGLSPLARTIDMVARLGGKVREAAEASQGAAPWMGLTRVSTDSLDQMRALLAQIAAGQLGAEHAARALELLDAVPVGVAFGRLGPMVRDLADCLGKSVDFSLDAPRTSVPRRLIEPLHEAALHMVRNAVDHGIEVPTVRSRADKPERGTVRLGVTRSEGVLTLVVQDDGGGIRLDGLRQRAVDRGLHTVEEVAEMAPEALHQLIFQAGFTTADAVTEVSGRGVGMDVVSAVAVRLGGTLSVDSKVGVGTRISLSFPVDGPNRG